MKLRKLSRLNSLVAGSIVMLLACVFVSLQSAQAAERFFGQVSVNPTTVSIAGEDIFSIPADAGAFTAAERAVICERNIHNALLTSKDRSPNAVDIEYINHLPVIRVAGKHCVTIDDRTAKAMGMLPGEVAVRWADALKAVLADRARVDSYLAQLSGDYLYRPYSFPFRRAQYEAARLNYAATMARDGTPMDLECSKSYKEDGMKALMKGDLVAACENFKKAILLEPNNARAHYGLGSTYLKQGLLDQAVVELELARWIDPDDAQVHLALGQAYEAKGLDQLAYKHFNEARLLQPDNPVPHLYIADMREERNDMAKSVRELSDAELRIPGSEYIRLRKRDQLVWRLWRPM
ncbi:MAG TPA: tetratricopeptide repeat protein [Candidatus Obscuribacterales bacterium]